MKTIFTLRTGLLLAFILTLTAQSYSQQLGDYRTNGSGQNFNTATVFDRWNGSGWVTSTYAPGAGGNPPFKQTVDLTSGSTTATITGTDTNYGLIRANQFAVSGTALQAGTTISSVSGSTINLSKTALTTGTAAQLNFQEQIAMTGTAAMGSNTYTITAVGSGSDILPGMAFTSGTNIPAGTVVSSVAGDVVTLSNNTTAAITTGTFFTKETTAATTAGSTTITLAAPNSLLSVGMNVYNSSSIPYGTKIVSVSGTTVLLSMPATATYVGVGVVFAYNIIPNLYINHTVLGNGNSLSSTVKNAWVNNQNGSTTAGIYNISDGTNSTVSPFGQYSYGSNPIFTVGNNANIANLVFQTLSIASGSLARTNQTNSILIHNLILNGGEGGNAINNNGIIDFVTSNGHKTNITIGTLGSTTLTGTGTTNTYNTLIIPISGTVVTLDTNASIVGGTLATGTTLTVNGGKTFTNTGALTNNGDLILKSSAIGTASLLSSGSVDNVTQQRYLSSNQRGWRLLSNPVSTKSFNTLATASNITVGTNYTGEYVPATNTWTSTDGTVNMTAQQAYKVFITGLTGEAPSYTTGPSNVTLVNKGTAANTVPASIVSTSGEFYLVANPYTAPVSLKTILDANTFLSKTVSYYDPTVSSTDVKQKFGGYITKNTSTSAAQGDADDVVIPPMGAIFVQASSAGSITVPKTAIFTGTPLQAGTYTHKSAQTKVATTNALKLEVSSGGVYYDALALQFKAAADASSNIDFGKLPNSILDAYSIAGSKKMAVSELELKDQTIPVGITSTIQKNYTFRVADNTIPVDYEAVLVDSYLNKNTTLAAGTDYAFTIDSNPASQGDARFAINLKTAGSLGVAANELDASIQVYPNPSRGQFNITNTLNQKEDATIEISSLNGQVIHTQKLNSGTTSIQTKSWASGIYILKASTNGTETTKKLIIQ